MAIKHAFNNGLADDPAAAAAGDTLPSHWNAPHAIDNATITLAMLANISTTQRLIGRNTAGAGVPEEVTASQLFDWVSNTNGVLLTRTAGSWAPVTNVTADNGDLQVAVNASPVAPAAGVAKLFAMNFGGKSVLAQMAVLGDVSPLQTIEGRRSIAQWIPAPVTATFTIVGLASATAVGTATSRTFASTNQLTGAKRLGYVSSAVAGNVGGVRSSQLGFWRGSSSKAGGFLCIFRFAVSDAVIVANGRMFVGLNAGGAPTDVDPSTLVNQLGIGCDGTDTVLQLYAAGAAAQARTSLGANFPVNGTTNTDIYELVLYCAPNDTKVTYMVTRLNTGDVASGTISAGANLPASTQGFTPQLWRSNNTTAAAVGIDVLSFYGESDT